MTWTGKYKLEAIVGTRNGKCNLRTRASKYKVLVSFGINKLGAKAGKYKFGPGPVNKNWGPARGRVGGKQRAGGLEIQIPDFCKVLRLF